MLRQLALASAFVFAVGVTGCSAGDSPDPGTSTAASTSPSIDQSAVPTAPPADVVDVDPATYLNADGIYVFKVGDGPAWCTLDPQLDNAVCELNELKAEYAPVEVPASCDYSYGYQIQLLGVKPQDSNAADFLCSGGAYTDPSGAPTLATGSRITVANFVCYVQDTSARCDNPAGQYIVLGPKAWALGN